ncbi:MAG: GTP 3',8-cyclase MoaA [Candidatus Poseidoniaceae archaeon]|nr:GTP 3',8-cyclase MoaA [Candidatus Poseidoniaceae archaeon]MBL6895593.1 GTP 3',8-cyclase MoaA [Candidatus Poseidoniaceae archaeon]
MTDDGLGRPLQDLRISVTDRCNFRCDYCMPIENYGHNHNFLPKSEILSFEEITIIVESMLKLGLKKVRITGGEPLLRKDICLLISMIRNLDSELDIAMTTNGTLLGKYANKLFQAGLNRVTVSLDAIEADLFRKLSSTSITPEHILSGISSAINAGLPVKVNTVIMKNYNEDQIIPLVRNFHSMNIPIRFIEYMDVGGTNNWNYDQVVTGQEIRDVITEHFGNMSANESDYFGEVSNYWRLKDGYVIGFIESVSNPFCSSCTRARISANGNMYTCLFANKGNDLKSLFELNADKEDIGLAVKAIWEKRTDRYSEIRGKLNHNPMPVEMHFIGG